MIWFLFVIALVATCVFIVTDKDDKNGSCWDSVPESQKENAMTDGEIAASICLYFAIVFLIVGILF